MDSPAHVPVLLDRVVALLAPALQSEGAVMVDATLGLGGHTEAVLTRCELARVVGIDRDPAALDLARQRLAGFGERFTAVHAVYDELPEVLDELGLERSTPSSSTSASPRCSSTSASAASPTPRTRRSTCAWTAAAARPPPTSSTPTRPRSSPASCGSTARSGSRAGSPRAVVRQREQSPFTTSARLVELLYAEIPAPARRTGGHPAKRTFQALRMEVNDELAVLRRAVPAAVDAIRVGGRVVVESYHSLEDRLVKQAFTAVTRSARATRPAGGARGAAAGLPAGDPRRRAGRRRRDRHQPPRRLGPAARRRTHQAGSSRMSTPALQLRERLPRLAEDAVARARLTVVPRRRVRAARMPFVTLVSLVLLGGVVGLLCFNTQMQQASFAATSLEAQSDNLAAREQTLHDELQALRNPQNLAAQAQAAGMVVPQSSCTVRLAAKTTQSDCAPATADNTPPLLPRPPKKPPVLDPDPIVVTVPPPPAAGPAAARPPRRRGGQHGPARHGRRLTRTSRTDRAR